MLHKPLNSIKIKGHSRFIYQDIGVSISSLSMTQNIHTKENFYVRGNLAQEQYIFLQESFSFSIFLKKQLGKCSNKDQLYSLQIIRGKKDLE